MFHANGSLFHGLRCLRTAPYAYKFALVRFGSESRQDGTFSTELLDVVDGAVVDDPRERVSTDAPRFGAR